MQIYKCKMSMCTVG